MLLPTPSCCTASRVWSAMLATFAAAFSTDAGPPTSATSGVPVSSSGMSSMPSLWPLFHLIFPQPQLILVFSLNSFFPFSRDSLKKVCVASLTRAATAVGGEVCLCWLTIPSPSPTQCCPHTRRTRLDRRIGRSRTGLAPSDRAKLDFPPLCLRHAAPCTSHSLLHNSRAWDKRKYYPSLIKKSRIQKLQRFKVKRQVSKEEMS